MKSKKKYFLLLHLCFTFSLAQAQYEIKPVKGYSTQIGIMVNMLEDLKGRITEMTSDLDQAETDYMFDEKANSIGALIMHLAATEAYYQVETLEGRAWSEKDEKFWAVASSLGDHSRKELQGKPIKYYLDLWDQVRQKTLEGLKKKDDAWFAENVDEGINNHWVWFHVMEHSANHMGQIALVKNRLPKK
ncbi:DinB family protein [Flammeovirga sp. OC4]|uniref:DinB family protein n=1 Tax=Flammeovirga sp. OC4 TaxID=1382345 RepID=UPI0005C6786D|nr:DinB family protein [Flammeovirga sp. OC4]